MPTLQPGEQENSIGELSAELTQLGFTQGTDFGLHYTWDLRPILELSDAAYAAWQAKRGVKPADPKPANGKPAEPEPAEPESTPDQTKSTSDKSTSDSPDATAANRATTRRKTTSGR